MKRYLLIIFVALAGIYTHSMYGGSVSDWDVTNSDLGEKQGIQIHAYPNPTNGIITIEVNGDFEIKIYDLVGQDLGLEPTAVSIQTEQKKESFNLNALPVGIYFIKVLDNINQTHKMIKIKKL